MDLIDWKGTGKFPTKVDKQFLQYLGAQYAPVPEFQSCSSKVRAR